VGRILTQGKHIKYTIDSPEIKALSASDSRLTALINRYGDLEYELHTDGFTFLVETIVGQMLSNKVSDVITSRLHNVCGGYISIDAIRGLAQSELKSVGLSGQKTSYIKGLAEEVHENPRLLKELDGLSDDALVKRLTAIKGIGSWSAKMYLIFVLDRKDVLPFEDGAFLQAYKWLYSTEDVSRNSIEENCRRWSPWASVASRYLYRALDSGYTKELLNA
jgi:DNA-3-methyladenine glycosylase II